MIPSRTNWGKLNITLDAYLRKNHVSKNRLSKAADLQYTQLQAYCKNEIQRPDLAVLARICYALGCTVSDILEYIPPDE